MTRVLGLLGGMSWLSSLSYYEKINHGYIQAGGEGSNPRIILDSLIFSEVLHSFQNHTAGPKLLTRCQGLEASGATAIVIPCNTVHNLYDDLQRELAIPIFPIVISISSENRLIRP